jgi:hypothetical protein
VSGFEPRPVGSHQESLPTDGSHQESLVGLKCITEIINWLLYCPQAPLSENMSLEEQNLKFESTKPLPFPKKMLSRIIKFSIQLITPPKHQ